MLGGHERDRRRARLGLRLSGASLTIRHGLARFPAMGGLGYLILGPLAPPQRNTRLLVTLIIAAVVAVGGAVAVIVIITGGSSSGGYGLSATGLASDLGCTAPHPSPSSTDDVNTGLRIRSREVRAPSMPYVGEPGTGNVPSGHALKLEGKAFLSHLDDDLAFCASFFEVSHGLSG